MKVLFLATRVPVPPWRGDQVRAYHQLRLLGRRHDLTLALLTASPPSASERRAIESWGVRVEHIPVPWRGAPFALARAIAGNPQPLQTLLYRRPAAHAQLAVLLATERFDLVHAQLIRTGAYLPGAEGPPVVIDLIDALSENMRRRAVGSRGPMAWIAGWEATRVTRYERQLVDRVAAAVVVAPEDAALIGDPRVHVVPNGVDLDAFPFSPLPRPGTRIVFAGNLGYFPNVDAAQWLAHEILPRVRARVPAAELHLVGARPARAVRDLADRPGISVAADVPNMATELAAAQVAVLPMRAGTGLQNKVLEALAVGTPVVTTPRAVAALTVRAGEHLLVADDPDGIADATVRLLTSPEIARTIALHGRRFVEAHYSWAAPINALETIWADAVSAGVV